ncbi:MAG TPA: MBL fold metallo-hydrolase [Acidimicrobiales bacterium]|nr:MBL fold metallo-hydrolase [Acidimicrobiales bacterium]
MSDGLYFRQLLSGRDFAVGDPMASQMVNFVYLIGDRATGEAVVVDPAYRIDDILELAGHDGMHLTGALATHYHFDHVGGSFAGHDVEGIVALLERQTIPIHVNAAEAEWVEKSTGVSAGDLVTHASGDTLQVGGIDIQLLHTPGHTPGSQCFLVGPRLVSGDTLFLEGCGRTDLPGSDSGAMFDSLQRLAALPDDTIVFPGHRYSEPPAARLAEIKDVNFVFKPKSKQQWFQMFGVPQ